MTERTGASNWLAVVLAIAVSGVFVALGSRMVWNSQRVVVARSAIYREMVAQKRLGTRRDELMNTVAGLKATTRMESCAPNSPFTSIVPTVPSASSVASAHHAVIDRGLIASSKIRMRSRKAFSCAFFSASSASVRSRATRASIIDLIALSTRAGVFSVSSVIFAGYP